MARRTLITADYYIDTPGELALHNLIPRFRVTIHKTAIQLETTPG